MFSGVKWKPAERSDFKLQFIGQFFLCTFLSIATEKYQKSATKGLSALWTPVSPIRVCLTEDIHGGGFEKRSAKACGDAFLTPRQTQPKADARRWPPPVLPTCRAARQLTVCSSGGYLQVSFARQGKQWLWTESEGRAPRGRRSAVRAGIRVLATFRAIRLFRRPAKESRGSGGGFLKGGPVGDSLEWRSFVKCLHFAFHLDIERKVHKHISPTNCNLCALHP